MTPRKGVFKFRQAQNSKKQRCLSMMATMNQVELSYLAGIVDGEGTISFRKMLKGYYRPILEITNTDPLLISYLHRWFWQKVTTCKNVRQVPYFRAGLGGFGIGPVLEALYPYLVAKKLQAHLLK